MNKTCLLSGNFTLDVIIKREYPEGFTVGTRNKFTDTIIRQSVGNTCGNVSAILPYLGVQTFPIGHFDCSQQGVMITADLERYGADTRFIQNTPNGGTPILECRHKLSQETGEHCMSFHGFSPGSRFTKRKYIRERDEAPALLASLDFTPDVYFFDAAEAGIRFIAANLREKGTLVYFEPESAQDEKKFLKAVEISDVIKFSGEKVTDISFTENYKDKLFIRTLGEKGLEFNLCGQGWQKVAPVPNDNVVDWEGAGDWTSSQFIACLCDKDILSIGKMTNNNVRECLQKASETASRSVSYLSSKGMIDAEKGWDTTPIAAAKAEITDAPTKGILGAICGDIIGSTYEQRAHRTKDVSFKLFPSQSRFTDDSVLTIAIAKWVMGERSNEALADALMEYGAKYPAAGYGHNFKQWVKNGDKQPYGAASNGSAMRVSPVGWACSTLDETLALAKQSADATHNSKGGEDGAMSVAAAIFLARTGHSKAEIKEYIEKTFGYNLSRTIEGIRADYKFEALCEKSVPEAIICYLQSNTYEEAVRNAVALGGDADTQAAIAGAIAAATPGMELPQEFANKAWGMLNADLQKVVTDFYKFIDKA